MGTRISTREYAYSWWISDSDLELWIRRRIVRKTPKFVFVSPDQETQLVSCGSRLGTIDSPWSSSGLMDRGMFRLDRVAWDALGEAYHRPSRILLSGFASYSKWWANCMARRECHLGLRTVDPEALCFTLLALDGIPTRDEIESAFRRLALQHHPDHGGDADAFKIYQAAREQALEMVV